jgi:hypothetical protein
MEQLTRAQDSSDLGESHEGPGDVDWIRASGMVAQQHGLALALWRLTELHDRRSLVPVYDGLVTMCGRLGFSSNPVHIVSRVLEWMVQPVCPVCSGRGHPVIPGTPTLSDQPCGACEGTGQRVPPWGDHERSLYERIKQMQAEAAAALSRKLRG